jgi:hypothetical protein
MCANLRTAPVRCSASVCLGAVATWLQTCELPDFLAWGAASYRKATGERAKAAHQGLAIQKFRSCRRGVIGFRLIDGDEIFDRADRDQPSRNAGWHPRIT